MRKFVRTAVRLAAATLALGLLPLAATPAQAGAGTFRLSAGEQLGVNARLVSPNGQYVLVMQSDGNLVEYAPGNRAVWSTGTNRAGSIVRMQTDGNLVVVAPGNISVWWTSTHGNPGAALELQDDGNAVVYGAGHVARWASGVPGGGNGGGNGIGDRIASIARGEAANAARNKENGANCNYYSGALNAGSRCAGGWRSEAWCADFARWVWRQAGANTTGLTAGAISFQSYGTRRGTWHGGSSLAGARAGDVIGWNFGGSTSNDHVGVIVAVGTDTVTTVDGNYNNRITTRTIRRGTAGVSGYSRPQS
ncbi:CHAP domain-containing protein [Actinoplanes xinjiangensis]|uniref:CHAP domain-containing protein n=1 Tax=Actinoplanes xinjiangensis TaxID=512350 RepID=UPI003419EB8C